MCRKSSIDPTLMVFGVINDLLNLITGVLGLTAVLNNSFDCLLVSFVHCQVTFFTVKLTFFTVKKMTVKSVLAELKIMHLYLSSYILAHAKSHNYLYHVMDWAVYYLSFCTTHMLRKKLWK